MTLTVVVSDEFEPLLSVWGIGKILVLTIMHEAGDMNRFASAGNFASYCRCADAHPQSRITQSMAEVSIHLNK